MYEDINAPFYPLDDIEHFAQAILRLCKDEGKDKILDPNLYRARASQDLRTCFKYYSIIRPAANRFGTYCTCEP